MAINVLIANGDSSFMRNVAFNLKSKYGWNICYFIGPKEFKSKVKKMLPNVIYHEKHLAKTFKVPSQCRHIPLATIDKKIIKELSYNESIYIKLLDRINFDDSFTYSKRIITYHTQLMYWKGVLDYFKPNIVVFRIAPHGVFDYIIYTLCKLLDIKTIMFDRPSIPGLIIPVYSFETGSITLFEEYKLKLKGINSSNIKISKFMEKYISSVRGSYQKGMPLHTKKRINVSPNNLSFSNIIKEFLKLITTIPFGTIKDRKSQYYKFKGLLKRKQLHQYYDNLSIAADLNKPYILVALQCEPERQASPCGDAFSNQYLMIDLLSKCIPNDWTVYVKEHISQYKNHQNAELSRTKMFYDFIDSKPNVELINNIYNSFDLIDKSIATATISGTIGWESVLRGKPALLFGFAWFRECEGVFITDTKKRLQRAINIINNNYKIDDKKILLYLSALENIAVKGYIDKLYEENDIVSKQDNIINITEAIYRLYNPLK